jgi:hypothetical protein
MVFGIPDDGKSPEKSCEFCTTHTIVSILSSLTILRPQKEVPWTDALHIA